MKKIVFAIALTLAGSSVHTLSAQPWMKAFEGRDSVKLQDVVDAYNAAPRVADEDDEELQTGEARQGAIREGRNYHFDRWKWYWEQHLDVNGYMISPLKNYQEWEAYKARLNSPGNNAHAKHTANSSSNWSFFGTTASPGSGEGVGRIQTIAFHPTDSNQFWIGSAGGGAWKTTNNGAGWTNMTSSFPVLGVSCITYNPKNPQVLYICTGDRDASDNSSLGVMKTTDGGATWTNITASFGWQPSDGKKAYQLAINPQDTATLLLATTDGIYKSYNSGASWTRTSTGIYSEVIYRPGDSNVVYATKVNAAQVYRSANAGNTFAQVFSVAGSIRLTIAVTPVNSKIVKVLVATNNYGLEGIYRSSDTGKTFVRVFNGSPCTNNLLANSTTPSSSNCDGQGWYDLAFAISPVDSNLMVLGGVNSWYSTNGGTNWNLTNKWAYYMTGSVATVHADKHFQAWNPIAPRQLFEGNDGGVYRTTNVTNGNNWGDLTNGLGITQFYRIATANYANYAIGGAQDNGSMRINSAASRTKLYGGDGMNCEMDPVDTSVYYVALYYGDIFRNSGTNISQNIPAYVAGKQNGDWITPYKLHPRLPARIAVGFTKLYLSDDRGNTWTTASPQLSGQYIKRVCFTLADLNTIYFLQSNLIRRTLDKGTSWLTFDGSPGSLSLPFSGTISDIYGDKKRKDRLYITYSGYNSTRVAVYDSISDWKDISGSLPNVPVNCITQDTSNGTLYIGTDVAVWYRDTSMADWALWNNNLPAVEITDLDLNYGTDEIWAGTYGRGIWKSPRLTFPPVVPNGVQNIVPLAADVIRIVPNPAASGAFDIQTANAALIGQDATVHIIDMAGRIVWSAQQPFSADGRLHVQTSGLSHGAYMVDVTGSNGMTAKSKLHILQ